MPWYFCTPICYPSDFRFSVDFLQTTILPLSHLSAECQLIIFSVSSKPEDNFFAFPPVFAISIADTKCPFDTRGAQLHFAHPLYLLSLLSSDLLSLMFGSSSSSEGKTCSSEGRSVSVLLRQGHTKAICCLNAAEMAFSGKTQREPKPGLESSWWKMLQVCFCSAPSCKSGAALSAVAWSLVV